MTAHSLSKMMAEANAMIDTVSVHDALELVDDPDVVMVDIRETVSIIALASAIILLRL